jgi:hypothetical protein
MLQEAGVRVSEFTWEKRDTENPTLSHASTGHYFKMNFVQYASYVVGITFSPGEYQFEEYTAANNWEAVRRTAERWVTYIKRELQEPDFWETIATEKTLIGDIGSTDTENWPFSAVDQKRIRTALEEIRIFLASTQELSQAQLKIIQERLDYLADASSRMGRKDWLMIATGVFTSIVVSAAFDPKAAHELFRFAGTVLGWILDARPLLIP